MKRVQAGKAIPIASSSAELLSVIKNFGFHNGFQACKVLRPLQIISVVSNCGMIVPTTLPIPIDVLTTKKKHGKAYLFVLYIASIHLRQLLARVTLQKDSLIQLL